MKRRYAFITLILISLLIVPSVAAETSITISNQGGNSSSTVSVQSSSTTNSEVNDTSSKTTVIIDGEVVVDEEKTGNMDITVKKEGNTSPVVTYGSENSAANSKDDTDKVNNNDQEREIDKNDRQQIDDVEKKVKNAVEEHTITDETLLDKIGNFFEILRSFFTRE